MPGGAGFIIALPGITAAKGSPESQALLGTPHGKGIVFLLTGHAEQFGEKHIESITIFTTPLPTHLSFLPEYQKHLLFTLTD